MFCTINYIETKKRISRKLKIEKEKIGEIEFLKATAYKKSALIKLDKKLNDKIDFVIVSENLKDCKFDNIKVYDNDEFLQNIAEYTFKLILKLSGIEINNLSLCVVDKQCRHPGFVRSLAQKASVIKVVTDSLDKYFSVSEGILEDFGVDLVINSIMQTANIGIVFEDIPKIWFKTCENVFELNKKCVKIGAGLRRFVPNGISECDFAGVLHNYNEFKRLKLLNASTLCKNGKYFEINENNIKNFLDNKL